VEAQAPTLFPEIERYFRRSRDAIARLEQTLRQLRQAHRGGAEPQVVRAVEVADEIEVALSLFEQRMRCITVSLRITRPLHAVACPHDLQQALWNLVDNALLAMPLGGSLDITASAQDAGRVVVAIEDSGPGVPEALRPTLFQPFSTGRKDGTGLGLSTSRRLVRAWGGDVRLADSEHGARFEIHLPTGERPCNATAS
jgi:signal transduction histidine kinase